MPCIQQANKREQEQADEDNRTRTLGNQVGGSQLVIAPGAGSVKALASMLSCGRRRLRFLRNGSGLRPCRRQRLVARHASPSLFQTVGVNRHRTCFPNGFRSDLRARGESACRRKARTCTSIHRHPASADFIEVHTTVTINHLNVLALLNPTVRISFVPAASTNRPRCPVSDSQSK